MANYVSMVLKVTKYTYGKLCKHGLEKKRLRAISEMQTMSSHSVTVFRFRARTQVDYYKY
jgi:hypothetical protein